MPHQAADTLYITGDTCFTIQDPGGTQKYGHNEDSWLYVVASSRSVHLQINYQTGPYDDGLDWLRIYPSLDSNDWYYNYCGEGEGRIDFGGNDFLIRFHSNNYAAYDGYEIKVMYDNTVQDHQFTQVNDYTGVLTWSDNNTAATAWTVTYYCDEDSVQTITTTTPSVTLPNLKHNTYYVYNIENNTSVCQDNQWHYFRAFCDAGVNLVSPKGDTYDTMEANVCNFLYGSSGPEYHRLPEEYTLTFLQSRDRNGFYLQGKFLSNDKWYSFAYRTRMGERSYNYWGSGKVNLYFPEGYLRLCNQDPHQYDFSITQENSNYVRPTMGTVTATSAAIQWQDSSNATAWTVRYTDNESTWQSRQVSTPSITLTGLQPGHQYLYTIEGNDNTLQCYVPARHAFKTQGGSDTLLMPYRGSDSVVIYPNSCYTILDAGGENNYFHTDNSVLALHASNGQGFYIKGSISLMGEDRMWLWNGSEMKEYSGYNNNINFNCPTGEGRIYFYSDVEGINSGISLHIEQTDTAIYDLAASGITANSATITWNDQSAATGWTVYYGLSEDSIHSLPTVSTSVTLSGLTGGTQYIYWVENNLAQHSQCYSHERKAFITPGVPEGYHYMKYRGVDTLYVTPGTCYTIWDAGGPDHDFFDYDTSELVLVSTDNTDFNIQGYFVIGEDEYENQTNSYDGEDRLCFGHNQSDPNDYYSCVDGWYHVGDNRSFQMTSEYGFLRIRFTSNDYRHRRGFRMTIDQDNGAIGNVAFTNIYDTCATVTWDDNTGAASWTVWYGPEGGTMQSRTTTQRRLRLSNLIGGTMYNVRIASGSATQCALRDYSFYTLPANSIVMRSHQHDTLIIYPGCYTIYDPGGKGDYLPNDTATLVIKSYNGQGFSCIGQASVGNQDYSDVMMFAGDYYGNRWWWEEHWCANGEAEFGIMTNEALQDAGFAIKVKFYPTIYNLDTLNMTDTSVTILWQDSSTATQWTVTYGPDMDSLQTLTVSTKSANLTGLRRNQQYYYSIESNAFPSGCVYPVVYSVIMPCDEEVKLLQYHNHNTNQMGIPLLYNADEYWLDTALCFTIKDHGGNNRMFYHSEGGSSIRTHNGAGITLKGYYDLGEGGSMNIYSPNYSSYSGSNYVNVYSNTGDINVSLYSSERETHLGQGVVLEAHVNYPIYNINASNITCTSAQLTWSDTSNATGWSIAYGTSETDLDTVTSTTRSYSFTGLDPDHQYVCYISNNYGSTCQEPVKYAFITTCDTHIVIMPYKSDVTRVININDCYTIKDPGADNNYFYNDYSYFHLKSNTGDNFVLRGWCHMGENDYLYVYGNNVWYSFGYEDDIVIQSDDDELTFELMSSGDTIVNGGFEFTVSFNAIANIQTSLMTDTTCRVTWDDHSSGSEWVFWYSSDREHWDSIPCPSRNVHLHNLVEGTTYYVYITNNAVECIDTTWFQFCAGGDNCIDYANLYSCHTICHTGRYDNPDEYVGIVDYGPDNMYSRHTIVSDTTATDPRTGGMLKCVPSGYAASVRLGNWDIGGQAESILYEYIADTTNADILLLRYAAVMEEPGHIPEHQPKIHISLVDEDGNEIYPECYSADFVASEALGWNQYMYDTCKVLWKDWTAVGIDMKPLQGQRFFLKITTYDCNEMGHFAYAYFTLECQQKNMIASTCGEVVANDFTMPEGFRYEWYNVDSSDVILSTNRSYEGTELGIYGCRAYFVGAASGSDCYFEKFGIIGSIYPYADFSYEILDTVDCRVVVQFYNHSAVTTDSAHTNFTPQECESFLWTFSDGTTSYEKHPTHVFEPGYVDVNLTAYIGGGHCGHDTTQRILVPSPCISYDTVDTYICSGDTLRVRDSVFTEAGDYILRIEYRPDSIWQTFIHLDVKPVFDTDVYANICNGLPYTEYGFYDSLPGDYERHYYSVYGCDSIYHAHLVTSVPDWQFSYDGETWMNGDTVFEGCEPFTLFMRNASEGDSTATWFFGDGDSLEVDSTKHIYPRGLYSVQLVVRSGEECVDTLSLDNAINVFGHPTADFYWDPEHPEVSDPTTNFINKSFPDDTNQFFMWYFQINEGDTSTMDSSSLKSPSYTWLNVPEMPSDSGYLVRLVDNYANIGLRGDTIFCADTMEQKVIITTKVLRFPNVVTPNGDGTNDIFVIVNLVEKGNYPYNRLTVYNRWGAKVYDKINITTIDDFWDPNATNSPDGTYFFRFNGQGNYGAVEHKGVIEVMRQ